MWPLCDRTWMPVLFSRVSPLLRWNHLQQPLALGELGFLLMRRLTPQLHLTKPLFACASPGLCHRPWINIHTDFGVPYEQLVFQPLYPQHSAAPNPNYYLSVQQDHCSLRLPLTSSRLGKIPKYKSQDRQGFLSMLLCSVCHLTPANSCFICSVCLIAVPHLCHAPHILVFTFSFNHYHVCSQPVSFAFGDCLFFSPCFFFHCIISKSSWCLCQPAPHIQVWT